jgi:alpha-D-xyloside xylohydrolase
MAIPVRRVWCLWCVAGVWAALGCGDDGASDGADAGHGLGDPLVVDVGDGASLQVETDVFGLTLRDADGEVLTRTRGGEPAAFGGLAVGQVAGFSSTTWYDPTLEDGVGAQLGVRWFHAAEALSVERAGGGATVVYRTRADDGEEGPQVTVVLSATAVSATLDVQVPEDETLVFTALTLQAEPGEGFYGLGEHFDVLDGRGLIREMQIQVETDSESGTNEVHVPVPYVLSTRGWGLFIDDRHPAAFDLARTREDAMRATFQGRGFEVHFLADPDPLQRVEDYTRLTAQPARVPFWSLGPVWWRNRNIDADEVLSDARRAREHGMPGSLMWIDRPWQTYYQNYRFNPLQFPDPGGMFEELRELGYLSLLHHAPQVNVPGTTNIRSLPDEPSAVDESEMLYDLYVDNGWVVTLNSGEPVQLPWGGGLGAFVDFSHPDAVDHVQGLMTRITDLGVVGAKMDWDEYLQPNVDSLRINMNFANGETNLTMKSWYSALYHKALFEGFEQAHGEPGFLLVRHASPRNQPWATCVWPGDLDNDFTEHTRGPSEMQEQWNVGGLPAAIVANQSVGLAGFPCFASDIGGFRGGLPEEQVLLRWMAFGVFNPVMQLGGGGGYGDSHMPWSEGSIYSEGSIDITRRFFRLRMDLFPYIHNELLAAEATGRPMVRPLWAMHPADPQARAFERDFYFGPHLLVAPVYEEDATERELYLPEGEWVDLWTGERRSGGQVIVRDAPLDEIPVHLRDGAIVPLAAADILSLLPVEDPDIVSYQERPLTRLWVVPGRPGSLRLFNGVSAESVTEADRVEVAVSMGEPSEAVHELIRFAPDAVELRVETLGTLLSGGVQVRVVRDGVETDPGPLGEEGEGWATEEDGRLVIVRIESDATVRIRPAM